MTKFHIVNVSAVIKKEDKYLIAQRSLEEKQAPGEWGLVGGKVEIEDWDDPDHILEKTLKEEIREEVGVEIENDIKYLISSSFKRIDDSSVITITFVCNWKSGSAKPLEDTIDVAWIQPSELDNYKLVPGVKDLIILADNNN